MNRIAQETANARLGEIVGNADGSFEGRYLFPESFAGFDGHFPNFPILPAIVEIRAVVALVGEAEGVSQRLVAVQDAKFLNTVRPGEELTVTCRTRTVKGRGLYDARLTVGAVTVSTMLLDLAPEVESA
jgi:3-hydroxyacyl-[acyl-carrier-protein] dehydratase